MEKELISCTDVLLRVWPNRARPSHPFWQLLVGWLCPVRSTLKRTPVQDFKSVSIMFYYIISTTYQKIGGLFCPVIFLDFCTVWRGFNCKLQLKLFGSCYSLLHSLDFNWRSWSIFWPAVYYKKSLFFVLIVDHTAWIWMTNDNIFILKKITEN